VVQRPEPSAAEFVLSAALECVVGRNYRWCGIAGAKFQRDTAICQKRRACVVPSCSKALGGCDVAGSRGEGGRNCFKQPWGSVGAAKYLHPFRRRQHSMIRFDYRADLVDIGDQPGA